MTARPTATQPLAMLVTIEIPRGSFRKVGSTGELDFLSPLPCPFNYGSVPDRLGLEGDLLDAVVLGPRLPAGAQVRAFACGAVRLRDRGLCDDKLICFTAPPATADIRRARRLALAFFRLYGWAKGLLNLWRRRPGRTGDPDWISAERAWQCSRPHEDPRWPGPPVPF